MRKFKSLIAVLVSITCFFSLFSLSAGAASSTAVDSVSSDSSDSDEFPYSFDFTKSGNCIGDTAYFVAYWPSEANVKWKVSDTSIAQLEVYTETTFNGGYASGEISFLQSGTFKLKGVDKKTGETIYKKTITVEPYTKDTAAEESEIYEDYIVNWPSKTIYACDYIQLRCFYPSNTELRWSVSDSSIVDLSADQYPDFDFSLYGEDLVYLRFKKAGSVKIKAVDTTTGKTVVKKKIEVNPYVDKIVFKDGSNYTLNKGDTVTLKYALQNTKGKKISVSNIPSGLSFSTATSDKDVVKIKSTANGKVKIKAVGSGTAKVKVKAKDGSGTTATIKIKVK